MSDEDSGKYTKLGRGKRVKPTNGFSNLSPPKDSLNMFYSSFILFGAGFLLPYNSFIMAMDYFKVRYPGTPVVFDMSLVYILVAFVTVFGNNLLVETFSLNIRIQFGYVIAIITLALVDMYEIHWEVFGTSTSYAINLAAVALIAIGCTVQQSSFYGYTSMLPPRYTQAVMVGESYSGVFTSSIRVATRFMIPEIRGSTTYFFALSIFALGICNITYYLIKQTDFVQFYIALCDREKTRITLEPTEDAGLIETTEAQYGVLKLQMSPTATETALSFSNPVYEFAPATPSYKVEEVVIRGRTSTSTGRGISGFRRGLQSRWEITKAIYPYMIAICLAYFTTLSVYPGIVSEISSCSLGSWMPVLTMACFNIADLLGKVIASLSSYWNGRRLVQCCIARLIFIPMIVLCTFPRAAPVFSPSFFPFVFVTILGLTNGILGSVPIIQAPSKVEDYHRELTGNMMTLLYNFGLTTGSLMAYFLEYILPPMEEHPCATVYYDVASLPTLNNFSDPHSTVTTSVTTALLTTLSTIGVISNATLDVG